jgi:hypothetical protein
MHRFASHPLDDANAANDDAFGAHFHDQLLNQILPIGKINGLGFQPLDKSLARRARQILESSSGLID